MAIIRNYNLSIAGGKDLQNQRYVPCWDNFVRNEQDIGRFVKECKYQLSQGIKPIVTVFVPKTRVR